MYCSNCGKELPNNSNYCPNCGKKLRETTEKRVIDSSKDVVIAFIQKHKKAVYCYFAWFLLHTTLYISSEKSGRCDMYFYPFDMSFSEVLQGGNYGGAPRLSFVGYSINNYDFTEFFAYIVLFPLILIGAIRSYPWFKRIWSLLKLKYSRWYEERIRRVKEQQVSIKKENCSIEPLLQNVNTGSKETTNELTKMPLFRRLIGSIIDKVLILFIFVAGYFVISPYAAPATLGTYVGLMNASPVKYEYIDKAEMNRYGTYYDTIDKSYQDQVRLATAPPHIGSTMETDIWITVSFVTVSILYFLLFEILFSASPGKRILGGVLLDSTNNKIGIQEAMSRLLSRGIILFLILCFFHYAGGKSIYYTIFAYYLIMDVPVFVTKRSLIDICTSTTYIKR